MSLNSKRKRRRARADEAGSRERLDRLTVSVADPGRVQVVVSESYAKSESCANGEPGLGEWDNGDAMVGEFYGLAALDNARLFAAADRMREALESVLNAFAFRTDSASEEIAIAKAELALQAATSTLPRSGVDEGHGIGETCGEALSVPFAQRFDGIERGEAVGG